MSCFRPEWVDQFCLNGGLSDVCAEQNKIYGGSRPSVIYFSEEWNKHFFKYFFWKIEMKLKWYWNENKNENKNENENENEKMKMKIQRKRKGKQKWNWKWK